MKSKNDLRFVNGVYAKICSDQNLSFRDFDILLIIKTFSPNCNYEVKSGIKYFWVSDEFVIFHSYIPCTRRTVSRSINSLNKKGLLLLQDFCGKRHIHLTDLCKSYFVNFQEKVSTNTKNTKRHEPLPADFVPEKHCEDVVSHLPNGTLPESITEKKLVNGEPVEVKKDVRTREEKESAFRKTFIEKYNSKEPKQPNLKELRKASMLMSIQEMADCINSLDKYLECGYTDHKYKASPHNFLLQKKWLEMDSWKPTEKINKSDKSELKQGMSMIDVIKLVKKDMELEYLHIGMTEETVKCSYEFVLDGTVAKMRQAVEMAIKNNSSLSIPKDKIVKNNIEDVSLSEDKQSKSNEAMNRVKEMMKNKGVFGESKKEIKEIVNSMNNEELVEVKELTDEDRALQYMFEERKKIIKQNNKELGV